MLLSIPAALLSPLAALVLMTFAWLATRSFRSYFADTAQRSPGVKIDWLHPRQVVWFPEDQYRERAESKGNPLKDFPASFAVDGWDQSLSKGLIHGRPFNKARDFERACKVRQAYLDEWRKQGNVELVIDTKYVDNAAHEVKVRYSEIAAYAERLWKNPDGTWNDDIVSKGITANRRGEALVASLIAYNLRHDTEEGFLLPVFNDASVQTAADEFRVRLNENARHGQKNYAGTDFLGIVLTGLKTAVFTCEADLMKAPLFLSKFQAAKNWNMAALANKYPDLNIADRVLMPPPTDAKGRVLDEYVPNGHIPYSAIKHTMAVTLVGKSDKSPDAHVVKYVYDGDTSPRRSATEAEVEAFFQSLYSKDGNAKKVMATKTIQDQRASIGSPIVAKALDGVLTDNAKLLQDANAEWADQAKRYTQIEAERDALRKENGELSAKVAQLTFERDQLAGERDKLVESLKKPSKK